MTMIIVETCGLWDIDYKSDNWEPEFMTIFVTWQLIVTLDSIRNSCDVLLMTSLSDANDLGNKCHLKIYDDIGYIMPTLGGWM